MLADPNFFIQTFFLLLFGHFLADFPLQGEYLSKAKNPMTNPVQVWALAMFGHSTIHAGVVFILTESFPLAIAQLIVHFLTDTLKCRGVFGKHPYSFLNDQLIHITTLFVIAAIYCD